MKGPKQTYFRDMIEPYVLLESDKRRPSRKFLLRIPVASRLNFSFFPRNNY